MRVMSGLGPVLSSAFHTLRFGSNPSRGLDVYTLYSAFAGSYFAVSQISGVAPKVIIHNLGPSMERSIKTEN